jgi:hypothetical protein
MSRIVDFKDLHGLDLAMAVDVSYGVNVGQASEGVLRVWTMGRAWPVRLVNLELSRRATLEA